MYSKEKYRHNNPLHDDIERVKDKARETREAISQVAFDARDKANELLAKSLKDAKAKGGDIQEDIISYVEENPVKAVGIAIGIGALLSLLLRKW